MHIEVSEIELEDVLSKNLEIIEPGLTLINRQYRTKYGKIDLFCLDKYGFYVIVEVKVNPTTNSPGQLAKYILSIKQEYPDSRVRGLLVAPAIKKDIGELCRYFNLNFKEISDLDLTLPTIKFF
ncbi:MAG: hypothetical protein CMH63_00175 [Nanoarchaeota archaeon]|nr:hypothetical protein [Nanoarchaeota archaeon]|tara:strand:+ start:40682 stop:41053 length:372 start_codon:yes stop_codon:yes gene_type:complete